MATYYKKIKGKNYEKKLIDAAETSVRGKGDGRISLNDAKKILRAVKDSSDYSDIEKSTIKYIRDHYDFTPEADQWFRGEIRSWAAAKGSLPKVKKQAPSSKQKKGAPAATQRRDKPALPPSPPEPIKHEEPAHPEGPSLFRRIFQFILIVIILVFIFILLIPGTREELKNRITRIIKAPQQREVPETTTPAEEHRKTTTENQPKEPAKPAEDGDYYTVQVKDDLISISEKELGDYNRWIDLYNANKDIIKNPTMIFPGQKLKLPAEKK